MREILPEEKLLRLIRGKKKQDANPPDKKPALKNSIYSLIQKYRSFIYIRNILWILFGASFIYLAVSFIYPRVGLKNIKLPRIAEEKFTDSKEAPEIKMKPYEFYLEGIRNRQIFGSAASQGRDESVSGVNADSIKDINLVGIISGENPQAVIEDKKTQKTYYLNKGQFIGEFQVEDIQEGKIILNSGERRFEIYL